MDNFTNTVPHYSVDINRLRTVDSMEFTKRKLSMSVPQEHSETGIGSQFVLVDNSNPEFRTVGIIDNRPMEWHSKAVLEHIDLDNDTKKTEQFQISERPSALRRGGEREQKHARVVDTLSEEKEISVQHYEKPIKERKSQVHFSESNMVLRSLERVEEILGLQTSSSTSSLQKVHSLSHIKEKPSSESAEVVNVSENIIFLDTDHQIRVTPSVDQIDGWEIESGFAIFKSLNPVAYSPSRSKMTPQSSDISYERRLQELEAKEQHESLFLGTQTCMDFLGHIEFSELFVNNTIAQARETHLSRIFQYGDPNKKPSRIITPPKMPTRFWSAIKHLTREEGLFLIETYIVKHSWFEEDWKYTIAFEGIQSDKSSDYFCYEANFSLPTKLYPIAQVTASLYFRIEVSRIIPPRCPIKVRFKIEGSRLVIDPDKFILSDSTLLRVLDAKLKIFKSYAI